MTASWELELAMIRQRAAANCGLERYPAELIRVSERLTAWRPHPLSQSTVDRLERRAVELVERLPWRGHSSPVQVTESAAPTAPELRQGLKRSGRVERS